MSQVAAPKHVNLSKRTVKVKSGGYPIGLFPSFEWLSTESAELFMKRGVRYHILIASGSTLAASSTMSIRIVGDQGLKTSWHELTYSETNSRPLQKFVIFVQ